jgi:hypothetical protein
LSSFIVLGVGVVPKGYPRKPASVSNFAKCAKTKGGIPFSKKGHNDNRLYFLFRITRLSKDTAIIESRPIRKTYFARCPVMNQWRQGAPRMGPKRLQIP